MTDSSTVRFGNLLVSNQLPQYCPYIKCFTAIQEGFDRSVELRMVERTLAPDSKEFQTFKNERRAFSVLDQANIVKVLDGGVLKGTDYYIINGVNTVSIDNLVTRQNRTFTTKEILQVLQGLSKALSHIHDSGYLHLDLGPHSAYLVQDSTKSLINSFLYGVSDLSLSSLPDAIPPGSLIRKTPEAIEGKTIDCKTDIYLLCALAYFMGTGISPFSDTYFDTDARGKQKLRPIPASAISGAISRQLDEVIMKGLSRDPSERYHFADELVATTDKALRKLEIKEQVSESAELTASSIRIDPKLIEQIRQAKKEKQAEIKKRHIEEKEAIAEEKDSVLTSVSSILGEKPWLMAVPVLCIFFGIFVSMLSGPSAPPPSGKKPPRRSTSSSSGNSSSGSSKNTGSTTTKSGSVTKVRNLAQLDQKLMDTVGEIRSNSTNSKSFKARWSILKQWYRKQDKATRAKEICSYNKLAKLKLDHYKTPDESSRELDALFQKAEQYIEKHSN